MFYVQSSFDPDYTFKVLAYGLTAVYDDGRLSNVYNILSDIYKLATTSFSDSAPVAAKYLMDVSKYVEDDGGWDKWAEKIKGCAMALEHRKH